MTITKEYITNLAESLKGASYQDAIEFSQLMAVHPDANQIMSGLLEYCVQELDNALIGAVTEAIEEEVEVEEEPTLAQILEQQVTAKKLSEQIREHAARTEVYKPFFVDYIKPAAPQMDLADSLKKQIVMKQLSESIKTQAETAPVEDITSIIKGQIEAKKLAAELRAQMETPAEDVYEYSLEEVIESVLDAIVDEIIEEGLVEEGISLHPAPVSYYEMVFATMFYNKVNEMSLSEILEYENDYTAYIMTELVSFLVSEQGCQLSFENVDGVIVSSIQ